MAYTAGVAFFATDARLRYVRLRTDCVSFCAHSDHGGCATPGTAYQPTIDTHHQEIIMNTSQVQDRIEKAERHGEPATVPLVGNKNREAPAEVEPAEWLTTEPTIWQASPSQWTQLGTYLMSLVLAVGAVAFGIVYLPWLGLLALIPVGIAGWTYFNVRARVYELTTERLRYYSGVFNRNIDEIELYRIKDFTIDKPFHLRIFGLGSVHLITSDRSRPTAELHGIRNVALVRDKLRHHVELVREQKGVREVDFDGSAGAASA